MGVLITGDFGARLCREHLLIPLPKEVEKNSDSQEVARLKKAQGWNKNCCNYDRWAFRSPIVN